MIPNEEKEGWHYLEKVRKNKDFCAIVMPSENDNTLEFNQYMKSDNFFN